MPSSNGQIILVFLVYKSHLPSFFDLSTIQKKGNKKILGPLTIQELKKSLFKIVEFVQNEYFLCEVQYPQQNSSQTSLSFISR